MATVALSLKAHQSLFLERVVPHVERGVRFVFRRLRDDALCEALADCLAHAWQGYLWALDRGKDPWRFSSIVADFAIRKTKVGRRVGYRMNAKDVYRAARSGRTEVHHLDEWHEALIDNEQTPVPDQVAFRLDFPAWLDTLNDRDRKLAEALAVGHSGADVAQQFGLSRPRVTQVRQQLKEEWDTFTA